MQGPNDLQKPYGPISERTVEELAKVADLPVAAERRQLIALELNALIQAANELSRKMSGAAWMGVAPATRFSHVPAQAAPE